MQIFTIETILEKVQSHLKFLKKGSIYPSKYSCWKSAGNSCSNGNIQVKIMITVAMSHCENGLSVNSGNFDATELSF